MCPKGLVRGMVSEKGVSGSLELWGSPRAGLGFGEGEGMGSKLLKGVSEGPLVVGWGRGAPNDGKVGLNSEVAEELWG